MGVLARSLGLVPAVALVGGEGLAQVYDVVDGTRATGGSLARDCDWPLAHRMLCLQLPLVDLPLRVVVIATLLDGQGLACALPCELLLSGPGRVRLGLPLCD